MSKRIAAMTLVLASFFLSTLFAATPDAFVGTWIWNPDTKGFTLNIKSTSANNYALSYANGETQHVVADGQFHKGESSGDLQISFQKTGDNEWILRYKHDKPNPAHSTAILTLSKDGMTVTEKVERISSKGDPLTFEALLTRSKPGHGIEGEWTFKQYIVKGGPDVTMTITSSVPQQITLSNSDSKVVLSILSLDGTPYKESGPTASAKDAYSARLIDDHTLLFDHYKDGSLFESGQWTVSSDGKTIVMVEKPKGKPPYTVSYSKQ